VFAPKSIVADLFIYELPAISQAFDQIEEIRIQTDLDRSVEILAKANNLPLTFLESQYGLRQDATEPVLRQAGIKLEHLLRVNQHLVWEVAAITVRNDCQPVLACHRFIAKLYELENLQAVLTHQVRIDFKLLFTEVFTKRTQRIALLHSLAQKELEVSDILAPVLDLAQPVEFKLFKSIEQILHTSQR
jgi:hypothetical protein